MIKINLLPLEERQSKWPVNRLFALVGSLLIILCTGIYAYNMFTLWNVEKQLQDTRNQYKMLQPALVSMNSANTKQQLIDKKNTTLTALTKERRPLYGIIQHLVAVTSPQIRFTDMTKTDKGIIQIDGWSATYPLVAEFMQTMEQDQFFVEPVLTSVEKDTASPTAKFKISVKPRGI